MKRLLIILLILASSLHANTEGMSAYKYLSEQAALQKKDFEHNQYEQIVSGGLAFLVGNIGYFTSQSQTLKVAYSGVQTVGILSVGQGWDPLESTCRHASLSIL